MSRVVITGMGVISSNAHGLDEFEDALRSGKSGIQFFQKLKDLNFGCQVGGVPSCAEELATGYFSEDSLFAMNSSMIYAGIAAIDCWIDAGFTLPDPDSEIMWDTGAIIGSGMGGMDAVGQTLIPRIDEGRVRRMGSALAEQVMTSSVSAWIGGRFGLGGQVTTNGSACTSGTEAIANAFFSIREGRAKRMIAGASEAFSHYIWGSFDAMRVMARKYNDQPERASRPMSASSDGFVPSSGAGILMLEGLESALNRGARIYAEIIGAHVNCGGQRNGGSIAAPNPIGVKKCIREAVNMADIKPSEIDLINGHLTATMADPMEIANWQEALDYTPKNFPLVNSTKSLIGHSLGAAGAIECVGCVLQLSRGFVHGSTNCEDIHPNLVKFSNSIPRETIDRELNVVAKSGFGFGDVNGCLVLKRWS